MEATIVQHAAEHPGHCFACGTATGPFARWRTDLLTVATAEHGQVQVEGVIYLCVGAPDNHQYPGCLGMAVELAGGASPSAMTRLNQSVRDRVTELEERIAELEADLELAEEEKGPQVVPVNELLAYLNGSGPMPERPSRSRLPEVPASAPPPPLLEAPPAAPPHPESIHAQAQHGLGLTGAAGSREGLLGATIGVQ